MEILKYAQSAAADLMSEDPNLENEDNFDLKIELDKLTLTDNIGI